MQEEHLKSIVYAPQSVEFAKMAVAYCRLLAEQPLLERKSLVEKLLHLLPALYLGALSLPKGEPTLDEELPTTITEELYQSIAYSVENTMGDRNDYLEVFVEDMKYSDTPVTAFVSENLADIYQDLADFIGVYQTGEIAMMHDALLLCGEHFRTYWGQKLTGVLRALHALHFDDNQADEYDYGTGEAEDGTW